MAVVLSEIWSKFLTGSELVSGTWYNLTEATLALFLSLFGSLALPQGGVRKVALGATRSTVSKFKQVFCRQPAAREKLSSEDVSSSEEGSYSRLIDCCITLL